MPKKAARKAAPKKVTRPSKTATKTAPKKAAVKRTAKKSTAKKAPEKVSNPREFDEHGFVVGSDSSIMVEEMLKGGAERTSVNDAIRERIEEESGLTTRTGTQKNIPALVAGLLSRLKERGYEVEATWRLVPPATPKKSKASKAAPKKTAAKKAAPKKRAAKKAARRR